MIKHKEWLEKWSSGDASFKIDGIKYTINDQMPDYHQKEFDKYCNRLAEKDQITVNIERPIKIKGSTYKNLNEVPKELIPLAESYLKLLAENDSEEAKDHNIRKNYQITFFSGILIGAIIAHGIHSSLA